MTAKPTVLTIEDQIEIRHLICLTLDFKGYEVLEAENGEQGLAIARARKPDLILLDVMMPGIGGLSAAKVLSTDPALKHIPVVMLSALGTPADIEAGLGTGVRAYLVKPFGPVALLELVGRLLAKTPAPA